MMNVTIEQVPGYTIQTVKPQQTITFNNKGAEWVFRINYDTKSVELNDGFDWDDAGKLFWEHVIKHAPAGFSIERKS